MKNEKLFEPKVMSFDKVWGIVKLKKGQVSKVKRVIKIMVEFQDIIDEYYLVLAISEEAQGLFSEEVYTYVTNLAEELWSKYDLYLVKDKPLLYVVPRGEDPLKTEGILLAGLSELFIKEKLADVVDALCRIREVRP